MLALFFLTLINMPLLAQVDYLSDYSLFNELFSDRIYNDRELEESDKPILISLGANCIPAFQALIHEIRSASYPFDWLVSDIESLYINLEENFLHFLDKNYCSLNGTWIVNSYDKIKFLHEFHDMGDQATLEVLPLLQEKYLRRIERFRQLKKQKKVFFMRYATCPWTSQEDKTTAVRLRDTLNNFFQKKLNFVLIILGGEEIYKNDWNIDGIKNYYVSETWHAVASDLMKQNLSQIFKDLGLIS